MDNDEWYQLTGKIGEHKMTVENLIKHLQNLGKERQDYSVRVIEENGSDIINSWIYDIEVSDKGSSGYELHGEIRLIGGE